MVCHAVSPPHLVGCGSFPDPETVPVEIFLLNPAWVRAEWIRVRKKGLVSRAPSCIIKRGPVRLPCNGKNLVWVPLGRCQ